MSAVLLYWAITLLLVLAVRRETAGSARSRATDRALRVLIAATVLGAVVLTAVRLVEGGSG